MALIKKTITDKIEVLAQGQVQVRQKKQIMEDGVEISSTFHRYVLAPDFSGNLTDYDPKVQAICNAVWTQEVKEDWAAMLTASKPSWAN